MTVALRPPEYFPRLPVAALLLRADVFIVADTFGFSRQSAQARARIRLAPGSGQDALWLSLPLRGATPGRPLTTVTFETQHRAWATHHLRSLRYAYGKTPFFSHYADSLEALLTPPRPSLAALTTATMRWTHHALGSTATLRHASELPDAPASLPTVWAAMAPPDATLLTLDESAAAEARQLPGVPMTVLPFRETPRRQAFDGFVPGLSVLDLLFSYGPMAGAWLLAHTEAP